MPIGENASIGVRREVRFQPDLLGGSWAASTHAGSTALGVERDQVPGADVKAVIASA